MHLQHLVAFVGVSFSLLSPLVLAASNNSHHNTTSKDAFVSDLVSRMSVKDIVLQIFLMFGDNIVGPKSDNALYDQALALAPGSPVGVVHDWYPLNTSRYNELQRLGLAKSHLKIPFMHTGECLHGVESFQQSMFPQALGMSASFDTDLVNRVGAAIGQEARSIGTHLCFSPVLDVCQDSRWGRCQEDWGEDYILTTHMGVAYASGMSKNKTWSRNDAVAPVMKHFAAHGSPQGGINAAPFVGHGDREVVQKLLVPFKAVIEQGGAKGVMMAYSELDDVPSHVNPRLYDALAEWGYDGFVIADDTGMAELEYTHLVASSPADAIKQWLNAGGMISFYDYPLDVYLDAIEGLVKNGSVAMSTLQDKARAILNVKWDLGLFDNPYIPENIDPYSIVDEHVPLTLEAAQKSIVLLENKNSFLPLKFDGSTINKLAVVGPFSDSLNYGDYSGTFGSYPLDEAYFFLGANDWLYNAQYPIPGYHLRAHSGTSGGLHATYYADTNFSRPKRTLLEVPVRDWGLYPPPGLPSNNFSAVWEGTLTVPVDIETEGWLGVAILYNSTAKLYIDGHLHVHVPLTTTGNILPNIEPLSYSQQNSTSPPPGSEPFTFRPGAKHSIRLEFKSWNLYQKFANQNSLNAQILLFWNLVDRHSPVEKAVSVAKEADAIILAVGANWNSDGESGDRATLDLSANQTQLADAIFALNKPVVLILEGGRPFAIPDYYNRSAAVLNSYFLGQSGGQAIADVVFGEVNPGGRLPLTIPASIGQLPVYYNYKPTAHGVAYVDIDPTPTYPFGYGLSYTNFSTGHFTASARSESNKTKSNLKFSASDTITFTVDVENTGAVSGSYVPQVYLLSRVSQIVQPVKQLMAFMRVYLEPGEITTVRMEVEVDRYLKILNRRYEWEVEKGSYPFALLENGGMFVDTSVNLTMTCV